MFNKKEYYKRYYVKNRETILKRSKQYYEDNFDECNETRKQYRRDNLEECRKQERQWREDNREKTREGGRQYYKDNLKEIRKRQIKRARKRRQYIQKYKLSKGCKICGYNKCAEVLVFHHHNGDKEFNVGTNGACRSLEKIKKEIKKCEILCKNCHGELHAKERKEKKII